jgi:hypothetical protein
MKFLLLVVLSVFLATAFAGLGESVTDIVSTFKDVTKDHVSIDVFSRDNDYVGIVTYLILRLLTRWDLFCYTIVFPQHSFFSSSSIVTELKCQGRWS